MHCNVSRKYEWLIPQWCTMHLWQFLCILVVVQQFNGALCTEVCVLKSGKFICTFTLAHQGCVRTIQKSGAIWQKVFTSIQTRGYDKFRDFFYKSLWLTISSNDHLKKIKRSTKYLLQKS